MIALHAYLTFAGNCREAMTFYQHCLGGELTFQTVGEAPGSEELSAEMQACILSATLKKGGLVLMGSDMVPEQGLHRGNGMSILLYCSSEEEARALYGKLSENGTTEHPPEKNAYGELWGDLTDRFGNGWLIVCSDQE